MKDAALRSLNRKADIGIRGSAPHSRLAADGPFSTMLSTGQTQIRIKGKDNRYEEFLQHTPTQQMQRTQIRESNNRLKALQELDRRREEQLKKEFKALDERRKQQEEETQKRISMKQMRLAETGYLSGTGARFLAPISSSGIKDEKELNPQNRFLVLVIL